MPIHPAIHPARESVDKTGHIPKPAQPELGNSFRPRGDVGAELDILSKRYKYEMRVQQKEARPPLPSDHAARVPLAIQPAVLSKGLING